jgi:hypothetical protein
VTRLLVLAVCAALLPGAGTAGAGLVPTPIGATPAFHPSATSSRVDRGLRIGSLRCERPSGPRVGVHLELFARGLVVVVPAGIGVAPPLERSGAYVRDGRCSYAVRTREPTGVLEVAPESRTTVADFFAIWNRRLERQAFLGFHAHAPAGVRAYVDGRAYRGPVGSIALRRHREIVLEIGAYVPPHASYRFRRGL